MCNRGQINSISNFRIKEKCRNFQLQQRVAFGREVLLEKFFLSLAAHSLATAFAFFSAECQCGPAVKLDL